MGLLGWLVGVWLAPSAVALFYAIAVGKYDEKPKTTYEGAADLEKRVVRVDTSDETRRIEWERLSTRRLLNFGNVAFLFMLVIGLPFMLYVLLPVALASRLCSKSDPTRLPTADLLTEEKSKMIPPPADRKYDIIIFGATGCGGRGVIDIVSARYLEKPGCKLKVAVCARNPAKMERILKEMKDAYASDDPDVTNRLNPSVKLDILQADLCDLDSVRAAVQQTRAVISCAGPFIKYGTYLVQACAEMGVHYADITGEYSWVSHMRDRYHELAEKTGAVIMHACGYDIVPMEGAAHVAHATFKEAFNKAPTEIHNVLECTAGQLGGATLATVVTHLTNDGGFRSKKLKNPKGKLKFKGPFLSYDKIHRSWVAPYFFAIADAPFLSFSNKISGSLDGVILKEAFRFEGFGDAFVYTVAFLSSALLMAIPPTRKFILSSTNAPGEPIARSKWLKGYWRIQTIARDDDGNQVVMKVAGAGDPGYRSTTQMLTETLFAVLRPEEDDVKPPKGGVFTPFSALGMGLARRLARTNTVHYRVV